MLVIDHKKRISVKEALNDTYFDDIRIKRNDLCLKEVNNKLSKRS